MKIQSVFALILCISIFALTNPSHAEIPDDFLKRYNASGWMDQSDLDSYCQDRKFSCYNGATLRALECQDNIPLFLPVEIAAELRRICDKIEQREKDQCDEEFEECES